MWRRPMVERTGVTLTAVTWAGPQRQRLRLAPVWVPLSSHCHYCHVVMLAARLTKTLNIDVGTTGTLPLVGSV